ncbi:SDR family NAD(P)-dependent oxidoreductase [Phaeodactylibacter luteus]|uniref:SDR family NAD(P)-dependent oxidoreductase n=1 Tax=Phaeodactylibacter luteus TaxID=1564516 RepID=A0A5C6S384_9BACT|nr:SDR family NAD(P)-dependent oxidoreductase [Phaeodactylibacter luteus]TXB68958.1 SDR family NAD(P)-dependent oxidoreductase [Phaeodactylibacter luteus]
MKNVIISGAAGGLGLSVTEAFLENGYAVHALTEPGKSEQVARLQQLEEKGHLAYSPLNVMDEQEVARFFEERSTSWDAAVFLVGGFAMGTLAETDEEALDKMLSLNFKSAYHCSRHALPKMAPGGRILLIGARPALQPEAGKSLVAYSLSKGMVLHLAELINAEAGDRNVQAVTVLPSVIDTPANRENMPDANFEDWVKPEEIAQAMVYACSAAGRKQRSPQFKMYGGA